MCEVENDLAPTHLGGMTQFCRDSPVQLYTRKRLLRFYMTFLCVGQVLSLLHHCIQCGYHHLHIVTHFILSSSLVDDDEGPLAIPVEQLQEYRYEDGRYETGISVWN